MDQHKTPLYDALVEHINKNPISFHVPGHKNGKVFQKEGIEHFHSLLRIDATEITGLDDLHSPEGVILEAESLLANLYKVSQSFFLINGSTVGNLAMVLATCEENDLVLVQRNCHKSILNALKLAKAHPVFLEPEYDRDWKIAGGISLQTVKEALSRYSGVKTLILTYPNYYGMVYDLKSIITLAHQFGVPVLVDEAHGAHFILGDPLPQSAVELGADVVIQSAHKTLPAMTMGSYLHFNSHLINIESIKDYLQIFQSTSPSYPIMASLDLARSYLATFQRQDLDFLLKEIKDFKQDLSSISGIRVLDFFKNGDPLKVTIQSTCGINGFDLQKKFEEVGIFTELADPYNVLFVLPLLKENQSYPFKNAVIKLKKALEHISICTLREPIVPLQNDKISQLSVSYQEMKQLEKVEVSFTDATGMVAAETITPYPPGVPLILVGEKITQDKIEALKRLIADGARFQGGSSLEKGAIKIFKQQ